MYFISQIPYLPVYKSRPVYNAHPYFGLHFEKKKEAENRGSGYKRIA